MALQDLKYAVRGLKSKVRLHLDRLRTSFPFGLIAPATLLTVVLVAFRIEAGEHAAEVFGVLKTIIQNETSVGKMKDVFLKPALMLENVVNDTAKERDVVPMWMGTYTSTIAEVRVKRGSTWISLAPFSRAFMGHRKPTG
jgi:hypothetical protein